MQDFANEFANYLFVVDDQGTFLHVILRNLTSTRSPGLAGSGECRQQVCVQAQAEVKEWLATWFLLCMLSSAKSNLDFRP
jgi:hypothetical protein